MPEYGHFPDEELRCKCCKRLPPADKLGMIRERLERLRMLAQAPIKVHSCYRCPEHNAKVGGAVLSRHVVGDAADVHAIGMNLELLWKICESDPILSSGGLAIKQGAFVHIDCGPRRRWEYP